MRRILILILTVMLFTGCRKGLDPQDESGPALVITRSTAEFTEAASNRSPVISDPFNLISIVIKGDSVEITVGYSGGCRKHTFEVIWSETISDTEPPETRFIILHDANGDMCEAYITEKLAFSIANLGGNISLDTMFVNVLNGFDPADSTSSGGWDPDGSAGDDDVNNEVVFAESGECVVEVTATAVICGTGLYNNLWLALEETVDAGVEGYYFRKYLQPVAIEKSLAGFVPVSGKKYLVGAKVEKVHDYLDVPVCLAYSGPSVPVRIYCIKEAD